MSETGAAAGAPAGGAFNIDSLVDSAFDAMEADGALQEATEQPGKGKPKAKAEEAASEPPEGTGEGEEIELGELEEEADTRGTREDPIAVTDLPDDRYIKLKIDGREETVSLRELGDGYIREQTFRGKMKEIKDIPGKLEALEESFKERLTGTRSGVNRLLSSADKMFEFYTQDPETEAVGMELAKRFAQLAAHEKANPGAREQRHLARERAKLQRERQEHERTTQEREQQRTQSEAANRRAAELRPAWEAALKEAGFPKPTAELHDLVNGNVAAMARRLGRPVTPDEFKGIAARAIKVLELKPGTEKPAPASRPTKTPEERKKPAKNPHKRGSVDSLLFGKAGVRF